MKKTISYKVAQPPFGINGGLSLRNTVVPDVVDNKVYIPYGEPFIEAKCIFLGREGAVISLATPKEDGTGISYRICVASALLSQSFQLNNQFSKVMSGAGYPALGKYVDQLNEQYDPLNGVEISHSIYTKAAAEIDNSLSKAMASDETDVIDFSYQIEYYPAVLDKYVTLAGNWFKTKNREFYNPFINGETGGMTNLYIAERLGTVARSGEQEKAMQTPDGSFISFWPVGFSSSYYPYTPSGHLEALNEGVSILIGARDAQEEAWDEEYNIPG